MKKFALLVVIAALSLSVNLANAGRIPGPGRDVDVCSGYGTVTYRITFAADEPAIIGLIGDGSSDLDLFVYDCYGNLVTSSEESGDTESVEWIPDSTQRYRVVVRSYGYCSNLYLLLCN